jgi:tetratricopeptide (TPR) repeat protein
MPGSHDIFRLRKEGQHQEALDLARDLFAQTPADAWLIRAYGWCLHDGLKAAQQADNVPEMQRLLAEFERLTIGEGDDDAILLRVRENWRGRVAPVGGGPALAVLIQQAKVQSDAGNRQEALRLLREAMRYFPDQPQAATSLAWEIERALKDEVDAPAMRSLLQEYGRLQHLEKPSPLHSLVLMRATQGVERFKTFIPFLRWWDPANFRPEDFQRYTPTGAQSSYDSLVERVIKAVHKAAKSEQNIENIRWAAELVGEHYAKFPEQEWFEYYYGQLLVQTGDLARARELIVPLARRKQSEFWAWDTLAATYGEENGEKRLACLCRALLCRTKDESFLVNVHTELGALLVRLQMYAEAKCEIGKAAAIREEKNWKQPEEIRAWQATGWYKNAAALESNEAFYRKHAPFAETLLYEGLPVVPGVVMQHLPSRDDKAALTFVGYVQGGALVEVGVKTDRFQDLNGARQGQPVSLQVEDSGPHPKVVSVKRRNGILWDVVPARIGLVRHVNSEKGVTAVALGRDKFCLFHHARFPEMARADIGMPVAVRVWHDKKRDILRALTWEKTDKRPAASFFKVFEGSVEVNDGGRFGFVNREVYVPPELIEQVGLANATRVRGVAVSELNKKKNEYGWRALTAEKLVPYRNVLETL